MRVFVGVFSGHLLQMCHPREAPPLTYPSPSILGIFSAHFLPARAGAAPGPLFLPLAVSMANGPAGRILGGAVSLSPLPRPQRRRAGAGLTCPLLALQGDWHEGLCPHQRHAP